MAADANGGAAATATATFLFILLSLTTTLSLITPSLALNCNPQPSFPDKRTYSSCTALPRLNATLRFTFDPANSSLSLAFSAAPPSSTGGGGWVAWAINPTSTGMIGAQALMALKSSAGSVVAKTFNISSYHSIAESKLSFDVWDLSADEASGTMRLFASVKVPVGSRSLNQVWQVGGAVDGTRPRIHDMADANKDAKSTLVLAVAESSIGDSPAVSPAPAPASGVSGVGEASTGAPTFLVLSLVFLGSSYFGLY